MGMGRHWLTDRAVECGMGFGAKRVEGGTGKGALTGITPQTGGGGRDVPGERERGTSGGWACLVQPPANSGEWGTVYI